MLDHLAPARRRLVLAVVGLLVAGLATTAGALALTRDVAGDPAPQDQPGPVVLMPGYGGSTAALEVLAEAVRAGGREARLVRAGDATGDLGAQSDDLGEAVEAALADSGARSVDVVGYSAGGVVARLWVADDGNADRVRRVVTLASPHHGTDLASLAAQVGGDSCAAACRQLAPDSDLLRRLNAGDETPAGPEWVALWTEDDATVVPPVSGTLEGAAVAVPVQAICPGLQVEHADLPRTPEVIAIVLDQLDTAPPSAPAACPSG